MAGVVGSAPVSNMTHFAERRDLEPLFGANPSPELLKAISPITYANENYPPTLIFHGTADTRVHHHETVRFSRSWSKRGFQWTCICTPDRITSSIESLISTRPWPTP